MLAYTHTYAHAHTHTPTHFRTLLRYRIREGDSVLQEHSVSAKANATYQYAAIQDELIMTEGNLARDKVIARIKEARF